MDGIAHLKKIYEFQNPVVVAIHCFPNKQSLFDEILFTDSLATLELLLYLN